MFSLVSTIREKELWKKVFSSSSLFFDFFLFEKKFFETKIESSHSFPSISPKERNETPKDIFEEMKQKMKRKKVKKEKKMK